MIRKHASKDFCLEGVSADENTIMLTISFIMRQEFIIILPIVGVDELVVFVVVLHRKSKKHEIYIPSQHVDR